MKKIKSIVNPRCSTPPHVSNENISSTTSTVTTVQEVGNRFKFVEREEQMRLYRELVQNAFEIWQTYHTKCTYSKDDYKKNIIIPVIGGASGIGKTRFLNEIVRWMKDRVDYANSPQKKIYPNNETTDEQKAGLDRIQRMSAENLSEKLKNLAEMLIMAYINRVGSIDKDTLKKIQRQSDPFEIVANIFYELESTDKELPIIFLIHMDETQILQEQQLRQVISKFTSLQMKNNKILFLPTLSGLDVALLEQSVNTSGTSYKWIQLPLLRVNHYMEILDELFVDKLSLRENPSVQNALKDIEGPPRLLQMLLHYAALFHHHENPIPYKFYNAPLNIEDAYQTLSVANSNTWFRIFQMMSLQFHKIDGSLKTVMLLLEENLYPLVYGYSIIDKPVLLRTVIGNTTVNELVKKGLVFIREVDISSKEFLPSKVNKVVGVCPGLYLHLPFIYLHLISQYVTKEMDCPILSLINEWGREELTPEEAERLSINMLLFRVYLLRSLKYEQVGLVELIESYSAILDADVSLHKIRVNISSGNCIVHHASKSLTSKNFISYGKRITEEKDYKDFVSIINKPKALSMDWAVTFFNSKNIPTFLSQAPDLPHLRSQSDKSQSDNNLSQNLAYKNDDDDNMDINDDLPKHLILMGQDKRFIVTSLTQSMIRNEIQKIQKVVNDNNNYGFILLIITDAIPSKIDEKLRKHIILISSEEICWYFGGVIADKRKRILESMQKEYRV
ncbi:8595_t:CDS:2 [Funneliformis geosporum]|uniref:8595_t:CDS:1 n=1 Tax=Funneliformis geosporum TaxID=1117311 RepID=A0A9W4SKW4_9GLOM|nr:8595_t:CDS:2 [Funneliformis geosporum]